MEHYHDQISRSVGCVLGFICGWIGFGRAFEAIQMAFIGGMVTGTVTFFVHKLLSHLWNKANKK